jgi:hypothetical protein
MSKLNTRIAVVVLAAALSATAYAAPPKGGGGGGGIRAGGGSGIRAGGGGGARFTARSAISRSYARPSSGGNVAGSTVRNGGNRSAATANPAGTARFNVKLDHTVKSNAVRETLNSGSVAGALRNRTALRNPGNRARITATAATAGWHQGRDGGNGWWRHRNGGYGWVGPLYWPFAYNDMYDYGMWGNGYDDSFWGYGYDDIYAGLFAPYGYDDLAGYLPQNTGPNPASSAPASPSASAPTDQLTQMCGQDSRDIAGLPIDQFQKAIQPTDAQRAALDDLANASQKAAQDIKAACPADIALTAPSRLAAMQQRIEAMIAAVATIQPPLETFYGLLSDEQKARLAALANDQLQGRSIADKSASAPTQKCGTAQPGVMAWPAADIEAAVHPSEAQRASLTALQDATAKSADMLKASCLTDNPLTPPARFAAVGKRLDIMLQAVTTVRSALNDFYGSLSDEQKARFEAIGPKRTSQLESLDVTHTPARRRGVDPIGQIVRRLMSIAF